MKISDRVDHESVSCVDGAGVAILTNGEGGFAVLPPKPVSRYDGLFIMRQLGELYRVIESIEHDEPVVEVTNRLWGVERRRSSFSETLVMPRGFDAILYSADKPVDVRLVLDCKHAYDNREWGRNYSFEEIPSGMLISYAKVDDPRDDPGKFGQYGLFVAVLAPEGHLTRIDRWDRRSYRRDRERSSPPFDRSVFSALSVSANSFVMGAGFTKAKAVASALAVWRSREEVVEVQRQRSSRWAHALTQVPQKYDVAFACSANALDSLVVNDENVYAGLPWFFQFWARDSSVSSQGLVVIGRKEVAKKMLMDQVKKIIDGVRLPNFFVAPGEPFETLASLDGVIWTYVRLESLMENYPGMFTGNDRALIVRQLRQTINHLERVLVDGLVSNGPKETWMDTEFEGDDRRGCRVEMQALSLAVLRFAAKVGVSSPVLGSLQARTREVFWNGSYLNDGVNDSTVRPNIFIAAYVFPELLTKAEWKSCVESVLPKLWLQWGGLASIATDHRLFTPHSSGEQVKSYHRGDSWFWINAMAAIVLHRLDKDRYKSYIDKILEASTDELLFMGAVGHHAEISSADVLSSEGCLSQAWSNALYLELLAELFGRPEIR